jgi:hypothetical protein
VWLGDAEGLFSSKYFFGGKNYRIQKVNWEWKNITKHKSRKNYFKFMEAIVKLFQDKDKTESGSIVFLWIPTFV